MSITKNKNGFAEYPDILRTGSREPPESHHWIQPLESVQAFLLCITTARNRRGRLQSWLDQVSLRLAE